VSIHRYGDWLSSFVLDVSRGLFYPKFLFSGDYTGGLLAVGVPEGGGGSSAGDRSAYEDRVY